MKTLESYFHVSINSIFTLIDDSNKSVLESHVRDGKS